MNICSRVHVIKSDVYACCLREGVGNGVGDGVVGDGVGDGVIVVSTLPDVVSIDVRVYVPVYAGRMPLAVCRRGCTRRRMLFQHFAACAAMPPL